MKMIDDYKKQLIAADMSAGGKVIGRLPKREFMTVTKEFFNKKSVEKNQQGKCEINFHVWLINEIIE